MLACISQDRLGQPRYRPASVGQRRTDTVHHSMTGYSGAGIEAERPSGRPNVVQSFDGGVLSDSALSSRPRGRQLNIGGGKSLSSFAEPCRVDRSAANGRSVQSQQLGTEAFNPVPSLRAGVAELATTVRASRKRKGGDNDEEHSHDQHHCGQQNGGHWPDCTPVTSLVAELAGGPAATRQVYPLTHDRSSAKQTSSKGVPDARWPSRALCNQRATRLWGSRTLRRCLNRGFRLQVRTG
jgi:hypothetical protein